MNQSLTVVLPIHNAERTLQRSVDHVLEVASELTPRIELLIVDDGSTDDSFDVAQELASRYPQMKVLRQPVRKGLGPTLRSVRRRVKSDVVMVHDGVSEISSDQLRALWERRRIDAGQPEDLSAADLLRPGQNQAAMSRAHSRLMGFQLIATDAAAEEDQPAAVSGDDGAARGVGAIPPLPRPNFLDAVSDFALGE